MANSAIKITDIPVANTITINSKLLSVEGNIIRRTQLITAHDLTFYLANTALYKNQVNTTFALANSAYFTANLAYITANLAYNVANSGYITANLAYNVANSAYNTANLAYNVANSAYNTANLAYNVANSGYITANQAFSTANQAFTVANSVVYYYDAVALGDRIADAYSFANTRFSSSGGTIDGSVIITGELSVTGNVTAITANNLTISDNMIYLNEGSSNTDVDLGFAGQYNDGIERHAGFFRDSSDGVWKVFDQYVPEPSEAINIDTSNSTFRIADFQANNIYGRIDASNLTSGIVNTAILGSGTANSSTYLAGDNSWKVLTNIPNSSLENTSIIINGTNISLGNSGTIVAGAIITDDTTTDSTRYIMLGSETSGAYTSANVSSTKLTFNPSTGLLSPSNLSTANISYTGTLIGGNNIINIGSGQIYKDVQGNFGIGTMPQPNTKIKVEGTISANSVKTSALYDSLDRKLMIKDANGVIVWG